MIFNIHHYFLLLILLLFFQNLLFSPTTTTADDDRSISVVESKGNHHRSTNTYKNMFHTRCSSSPAYRFKSMNFIDEEYPRIYSPPSTKKPFRQRGLIAQDISTQSPSRNIHIKRTGSVIIGRSAARRKRGIRKSK